MYTITAIKLFSEQTYGKDQNHRVVVNLEGDDAVPDKDYSAFVQEKPNVGDEWEGHIKKTEKDDKIYWNFEFSKNTRQTVKEGFKPTGDLNRIEVKMDAHYAAIMTELQLIRGLMGTKEDSPF